ncbi:hypothetical protein FSARC_11233 [Fusarium sarcochroum]|uniref:Uncharacterized protein n=1 Tax=Fusarium sarcochroum TaxID=1208366 RepID=A0A8H4X1N5_9HYPO|nr:hypothetical protein FSARC_11233 [Fusarium sarcochroum]
MDGQRLKRKPKEAQSARDQSERPQECAPRSTQTRSYSETLSDVQKQTFSSGSRTGSSVTSRTRSTSPRKKPEELQKLEKHVEWIPAEFGGLKDLVDLRGSAVTLELFQDIRTIAKSRGYLPQELRDVREDELEADDVEFASENRHVIGTDAQAKDIKTIFNSNDQNTNHRMALHDELISIRQTVTTTRDFSNLGRQALANNLCSRDGIV